MDLIVSTLGIEPPTYRVPGMHISHEATGRPRLGISSTGRSQRLWNLPERLEICPDPHNELLNYDLFLYSVFFAWVVLGKQPDVCL